MPLFCFEHDTMATFLKIHWAGVKGVQIKSKASNQLDTQQLNFCLLAHYINTGVMSDWANVWMEPVINLRLHSRRCYNIEDIAHECSCFVLFSASIHVVLMSGQKQSSLWIRIILILILHTLPRYHPLSKSNRVFPAGDNVFHGQSLVCYMSKRAALDNVCPDFHCFI